MKKKLTLEEIFLGSSAMLGLRRISSFPVIKKEISALDILSYRHLNSIPQKKSNPYVAIITPQDLNQLNLRRRLSERILNHNIVLLILSSAHCVPRSLESFAKRNHILIAASEYDEHHLKSRLMRLIREKIHKETSLHGVIIESEGKGILITGPSGIGKTTAALEVMERNNFWIADDIAKLKKNHNDEIVACGDAGIRNLFHTKNAGIVHVDKIIDPDKIKKKTKIVAIIEVSRDDVAGGRVINKRNEILGMELPCLHLVMPHDRYLNKNLLEKSLRRILRNN
jgi:serine kinase of HPr protein (carbohydrate metabolism regulator)